MGPTSTELELLDLLLHLDTKKALDVYLITTHAEIRPLLLQQRKLLDRSITTGRVVDAEVRELDAKMEAAWLRALEEVRDIARHHTGVLEGS